MNILIVGATSAIAHAAARLWAAQGARLALAGRAPDRVATVAEDLRAAGAAQVALLPLEAADVAATDRLVAEAAAAIGALDIVLVAHGSLTDQPRAERDPAYLAAEITVNLTSVAVVAEAAARHFAAVGRGTLAVIGSVAGDRGKGRNYAYALTKAGLATMMEGLRGRFAGTAIRVVTIKPGPVDTPMTATHAKTWMFADAARVGRDVVRAVARGRPVAYTPGWWRWVMLALRLLPEAVFVRLKI